MCFFITLTILSQKSKILIKNVNLNPTRTGFLKIIKLMGIKIIIKNKRNYKGEEIGDLEIKVRTKLNLLIVLLNLTLLL